MLSWEYFCELDLAVEVRVLSSRKRKTWRQKSHPRRSKWSNWRDCHWWLASDHPCNPWVGSVKQKRKFPVDSRQNSIGSDYLPSSVGISEWVCPRLLLILLFDHISSECVFGKGQKERSSRRMRAEKFHFAAPILNSTNLKNGHLRRGVTPSSLSPSE